MNSTDGGNNAANKQEVRELWAGVLGVRPDGREQDEAIPPGVAILHVPVHPGWSAGGPSSEDQREAPSIRE